MKKKIAKIAAEYGVKASYSGNIGIMYLVGDRAPEVLTEIMNNYSEDINFRILISD